MHRWRKRLGMPFCRAHVQFVHRDRGSRSKDGLDGRIVSSQDFHIHGVRLGVVHFRVFHHPCFRACLSLWCGRSVDGKSVDKL